MIVVFYEFGCKKLVSLGKQFYNDLGKNFSYVYKLTKKETNKRENYFSNKYLLLGNLKVASRKIVKQIPSHSGTRNL